MDTVSPELERVFFSFLFQSCCSAETEFLFRKSNFSSVSWLAFTVPCNRLLCFCILHRPLVHHSCQCDQSPKFYSPHLILSPGFRVFPFCPPPPPQLQVIFTGHCTHILSYHCSHLFIDFYLSSLLHPFHLSRLLEWMIQIDALCSPFSKLSHTINGPCTQQLASHLHCPSHAVTQKTH